MTRRRLSRLFCAVCLASALILPLASPAYGRLVRIPEYSELFAKSDLVVIARPVTRTTDTTERTVFPHLARVDPDGKSSDVEAIGVETRFRVLRVIRGRCSGSQFVLHHFREADSTPSMNGPGLVAFDPDVAIQRDILLFLVRENDGRFAPYSGQTDPDFSIFTLRPAGIERLPEGRR